MDSAPATGEVLALIGYRGVIVGSWPKGGTKDLDVVIKGRGPEDGRNSLFRECLSRWQDYCESIGPGHLTIYSEPVRVEIFEGKGWEPIDDAKRAGMLTFRQARRRSTEVEAFGVSMKAVP